MGNSPVQIKKSVVVRQIDDEIVEHSITAITKPHVKVIEELSRRENGGYSSPQSSRCNSRRGSYNNGNFILASPTKDNNADLEELRRRLNNIGLSPQSNRCNSRRGSSAGCRTPKRVVSDKQEKIYARRNLDVINSGQELDDNLKGLPSLNLKR